MSSFNFLIRNSAAAPMLSIIPPDIIPTYEIQLIGAVKKYKIVADNMAIPAMISKHATNFATDIAFSRSIVNPYSHLLLKHHLPSIWKLCNHDVPFDF